MKADHSYILGFSLLDSFLGMGFRSHNEAIFILVELLRFPT